MGRTSRRGIAAVVASGLPKGKGAQAQNATDEPEQRSTAWTTTGTFLGTFAPVGSV